MKRALLPLYLAVAVFLCTLNHLYAAPVISSISPASAQAGTVITITGTGLSGVISIKFGATPARVITNTATQITVRVPLQATVGRIRITASGGGVLSSTPFVVTRASALLTYQLKTPGFNGISHTYAKPLVFDLNGDGLLDLLVGGGDGKLSHYKQQAAGSTVFDLVTTDFNNIDIGSFSAPAITDIDNDGKLDLLIGESDGDLTRYEQPNPNGLAFSLVEANFEDIQVGTNANPVFTDVDNDGLLDLVIGEEAGNLNRYEQNSANSTNFTLVSATFSSIDAGDHSAPVFTDLDGDGRLDLLIGNALGRIMHYKQSSAGSATFTEEEPRFSDIDAGGDASPALADLDGDGTLDLLVGNNTGMVVHYKQSPGPVITSLSTPGGPAGSTVTLTGTNLNGIKSALIGSTPAPVVGDTETEVIIRVPQEAASGKIRLSATNGTVLSHAFTVTRKSEMVTYEAKSATFNNISSPYAKPLITDIDKDGLLDLLVGGSSGRLAHYEQSAANTTTFTLVTDYFNNIQMVDYSAPAITDLDGDGLLDLLIGDGDGNLRRYEQTGINGLTFSLITSGYGAIDVGASAKPAFADIDGNGRLDLIIGERDGNLNRYEQNSVNSTSFSLVTTTFSSIDVGDNSAPAFTDLDGDGLLDLLIGNDDGKVRHYKQSAANSTAFTLVTNDFNSIDAGENAAPAISDIDGDGWLDLLVGGQNGNVNYYKQYIPAPAITTITNDTGISTTDKLTSDTRLLLSGSALPGIQVKIFRSGTGELGTAAANTSGLWEYDYTNTLLTDGQHTFTAVAADTRNNESLPSGDFTITVDATSPAAAISSTITGPTNQSPIAVKIDFDEIVTGFDIHDITIGNGTAGNFTGSGKNYTVDITPAANGNLTIDVAADLATDLAGNTNTAASRLTIAYDAEAPVMSTVNIVSNNTGSTSLARTGNLVTLTFTSNKAINTPTVRIAGRSATVTTLSTTQYKASVTIQSDDAEGLVPFTLNFTDLVGNTGAEVSAATDQSSVTIDHTAPLAPTGLTALDGNHQVTLHWAANAETDLADYQLYTATTGNPATLLSAIPAGTTTYTHSPLTNGTSYDYYLTAVDRAGNESTFSIQVTAIPKASQEITLMSAVPDKTYGDPAFDIAAIATTDSGLPLAFGIKSGPASLSGTMITITGTGTVTVTIEQAGNQEYYAAPAKEFSFPVVKANPVITWAAPSAITYGTTLSAAQLNASANVPGTFTYSPAIGTLLQAGTAQTLSVSFAPTDAANYTTGTKTVTIDVNKANPVITWATPPAITYGTTLSTAQLNASANVPGTFTYSPAIGTLLQAGTAQMLSVSFTPTDAANYTTATKTVTIDVNKANPVITWATPLTITYGTTLSTAQLNASANVPGTFTYSPAIGTLLQAGTAQTLSVSFAPTDAANYTMGTKTVTIDVNKANPVITWATPPAITYGTTLSAAQLNASANVPGTFTYSPAIGTQLQAGTAQTLSVSFAPTDAANYTMGTKTVTIDVNKANPVITWATPSAITYGTTLSAAQLNASANVPGTFTYSPAIGTQQQAGTAQTLSVSFIPTDAANYTTGTKTVTIDVNKANPVITWATPSAITYGTTLSAAQLNASANVPGTFTYSPAIGTQLQAGTAQTLSVSFIPTDAANYTTATKTVTIDVNKAFLTITANNKARCDGEANPVFTISYAGFVNGEQASVITAPSVSTFAGRQSAPGTYPIQLTGGSALNYQLVLVSGSLQVNALPEIRITTNKGSSISKGETVVLTASASGTGYAWNPSPGIIGGTAAPTLTVRPAVTTTYAVTVTNASGCTSTQTITIEVLNDFRAVAAANIMTPNGDGINDTWVVENIDLYPTNAVKVFDRAGRLLFEQQNYKNTWDATVNGSPLAEGTYYYIIDYGPGKGLMKGFITLIRN